MAEVRLKMRIDVDFAVLGILVVMKSRTIRHISVLKFQLNIILCAIVFQQRRGKVNPVLFEPDLTRISNLSIDLHAGYLLALEFKEQRLLLTWLLLETE